MLLSSVQIAKSHIRLPIRQDYQALKHVLRDWLTYTERAPLQQRETHPATLCIVVQRPAPALDQSATFSASPSPHPETLTSQLRTWIGAATTHRTSSSSRRSSTELPHVHRYEVPLELWTALLPWEVQRGLSMSELHLTPPRPLGALSAAGELPLTEASPPGQQSPPENVAGTIVGGDSVNTPGSMELPSSPPPMALDAADEDPYGVVTRTAAAPVVPTATDPSASSTAADTTRGATPGMLFVLDATRTAAHGTGVISFWSGAILHPIDVLFMAPTQPTTLEYSTTFETLQAEQRRAQVEDNHRAPDVLTHFFPDDELHVPTTAFCVHSYGHLDPFPDTEPASPPSTAPATAAGSGGTTHSVEARFPPGAPNSHVPRYVLETRRHVLQSGVQAALAQSLAAYSAQYGAAAAAALDASKAEIGISLELSDALRADLMAKAQLCTQYVFTLEDSIAHHLRVMNTAIQSRAAEEPLQQDVGVGHGYHDGAAGGGPTRRREVWLTETNRLYVTTAELAAYQAEVGQKHQETPWEAARREEREWMDGAAADPAARVAEEEVAAAPAAWEGGRGSLADVEATTAVDGNVVGLPDFVRPVVPNGVQANACISQRSLTLQEEMEGRPSSLAPSFTGRHEAGVLTRHAPTLSATALARYPKTASHMPVLPPIDYELFDLCIRLGVAQDRAIFYYAERIRRDWMKELKELRAEARKPHAGGTRTPHMGDAAVARMVTMVRDRSLQVPEDLKALVEAVAALKGVEGTRHVKESA